MKTVGNFGTMIIRNEDKYDTLEGSYFEIHSPSNHRINNVLYDAEINFVFKKVADGDEISDKIAYFTVLLSFDSNEENSFVFNWNKLKT